MEFYDITKQDKPHPGEYILYVPSQAIVLCGAYMGDRIKVLHNGRVLEDKVENFKKIKIGMKEIKHKMVLRMEHWNQFHLIPLKRNIILFIFQGITNT